MKINIRKHLEVWFTFDNFVQDLTHEVMTKLPEHIERDLMLLFEQSIGYEFRIKATPLRDVVEGVDWEMKMVKGRKYGDFAVDLCELCGGVKETPES